MSKRENVKMLGYVGVVSDTYIHFYTFICFALNEQSSNYEFAYRGKQEIS